MNHEPSLQNKLARDNDGRIVRRWHVREDGTMGPHGQPVRMLAPEIAKSLRGMVRP